MGIINWCDRKITELKHAKVRFVNGRPQIPEGMIYVDIPERIETFQFRKEIPIEMRKNSLIAFYSNDERIWNRLNKVETESLEFLNYGGIVGMDLSPSVNMLRPRQMHSILMNQIYNCLMAIRGVKVAINARIGDLKTNSLIKDYPQSKTLVFGNLGCKGVFAEYSMFQFRKWIDLLTPKNICFYGTFGKNDLCRMKKLNKDLTIYLFHGHNFSSKQNKKSVFIISGNEHTKNNPRSGVVYDYIVSHGIPKIKSFDESSSEGGEYHGS